MSYGPGDPPDDFSVPDRDYEAEEQALEMKSARERLGRLKRELEDLDGDAFAARRTMEDAQAALDRASSDLQESEYRAKKIQEDINVQEARIYQLQQDIDGTLPRPD